jgi:eukaryotic-like serine/threonine-protein kinase
MKIDPTAWPVLSKLLDEWLDLPASARESWLANLVPEHSHLLPALRQLLASQADLGDNLLSTLPKLGEPLLTLLPGHRLGPYRILSTIGHGGMGVVYRAERDDGKFEQRVAIKVVSGGLNTPSFVDRFQQEYRILASLEHPNIARLLDAGATEDGLPYFVMEYVEGRPIDRFCSDRKLSVASRLRLILPVCEAVQYAHQKLIVHRDLKPDNILVTEQGIPKLLDFGIAKVLNEIPGGNEATLLLMTPAYASPEQVRGEPVGVATDVYSLGCVLYKLLTGAAPNQVQGKNPAEAVRSICEDEPPKPSSLNHELGRDADNLLDMAMRKEAQRRYPSVEQFAADIGRYLGHEPIQARPTSTGYRMQKYIRRHRLGVSLAAGLALLLTGFAAVQAAQLRRITRERDRADRVTQFIAGMFKVSDPSEARGNSITAREILDKASKEIDPGLATDRDLQAQMMAVMGQVYGNLGLYAQAQALLTPALDIRRRVLGAAAPQTLSSMNDLAWNLSRQGHYSESEKLQRETLNLRRRVLGPEHPDTLISMSNLAWAVGRQARYAEAEKLQRETLDLRRRVLGPDHPDTLVSMADLAVSLRRQGHFADAEKVEREAFAIQRRVLGPEHPDTLTSMNNLANTLNQEDQYAEAEKLQREALEIERRVLGLEHPDTVRSMTNLANTLHQEGRYPEAEKFEREALVIQRRVLGPEHPSTLTSMNNLASTLNLEGHFASAEQLGRETLDIRRRVLGPEHPETLVSMANLATSLQQEGRYQEAEKLQRETLAIQRRVRGPENPDTAVSVYNLAIIEEREGKREDALKLLREAVDHGLSPGDSLGIEKDPDLKSLHGDARFDALVKYVQDRAAASQKAK